MQGTTWWRRCRERSAQRQATCIAPARPRRLLVETLESRRLLSADPFVAALAEAAHAEPFPQGVVAWLEDIDRVDDVAREAPAALPTGAGRLELPDTMLERVSTTDAWTARIAGDRATEAATSTHAPRRAPDFLQFRETLANQRADDATDASDAPTSPLLRLPDVSRAVEAVGPSVPADASVVLVFDAAELQFADAGTADAAGDRTGASDFAPDFALDDLIAADVPRAPLAAVDGAAAEAWTMLESLSVSGTTSADASASASDVAGDRHEASLLVFDAADFDAAELDALASWGVTRAAGNLDALFTFQDDPFAPIVTA
jgi:hypothetical protein